MKVTGATLSLAPVGGVEICVLQDSQALTGRGLSVDILYGEDGSLRHEFEEAGVRLHGPERFAVDSKHPLHDLILVMPSVRDVVRTRPDVLWLNRLEHIVWGQLAARAARCPLVCHLHGPPVWDSIGLRGRGVNHFIAPSEFIRTAWIDAGVPPSRITVVHNAVSPADYPQAGPADQMRARRSLGLPTDARIVLCYGQMSRAKGVDLLAEAMRTVLARRPGTHLVLLNSDPGLDKDVAPALAALDPDSFTVFDAASDVTPFLHASDIVAFPTRLPEAFGRVVIEGLSSGRPVVASRIGAIPEILDGPMSRFLVEPGDPTALAIGLLSGLEEVDTQPGLGDECVRWVQTRFPITRHIDGLESVLTTAACSTRRG